MQVKHLDIPQDTQLFNSILKEINQNVDIKSHASRWYFFLKGFFYIVLTFCSYLGLIYIQHPVLYILNYILFGMLTVMMCFNFAHDFSHNAIFRKPFWDNFFFEVIYTMVGAHPEAWKSRHLNAHHFAPNVENFDTDLAITNLIRLIPGSEWKWYHKFQFIYGPLAYMTYSLYWVFIKDFNVVLYRKHLHSKNELRYVLKFLFLKSVYIGYLLLIPLFFSHQNFWYLIIGFILMHLVQSLYTLFTFFITHHINGSNYPKADANGIINTSWVMNQIKSSNNFYPYSHIANAIFGGVNSHIAHHLFPHINHYYYPKINSIIFKRLMENGIEPSVTTYFEGVYSHIVLLKRMGEKGT